MAKNMINMDGSDDPFYRYTMPALSLKVEGTSKMIKSVITNVEPICTALNRPVDYLITFFGQEMSANSKIDTKANKAYVSGSHTQEDMQDACFKFIRQYVRCNACGNPETIPEVTGKKKNMSITLKCISCGRLTPLDSTDRFVKYMTQHPMEAVDPKKKKKKKKIKDEDDGGEDDGGEEKKKKKKSKDKDGEDGEKKKKKKKKDEEEDEILAAAKHLTVEDDESDDDWCMDTSASAVAARQQEGQAADITEKMEAAVKADEPSSSAAAADEASEDDDSDSDIDIDDL